MRTRVAPVALAVLALNALAGRPAAQEGDRLAHDERAVLFPTCASLGDDGTAWVVPVHGWVYEPEEDSAARELALRAFAQALGLPGDDAVASARFRERAWPFLVDNERGRALAVRVAGRTSVLSESLPSGHVHDVVRLDAGGLDVPPAGPGRWIDVALAPRDAGRPPVATQALLLPSGGVSVLSDIDDTVKVSEVRDTRALLERTFLRAFEPVDGAAARYRAWERAGATFHYVSASPWQLHAPLAGFLAEAGFPRGTLHLREFRLKDRSALSMFDDAEAVKRPQLEALLESFPERRVVLVGDSGERDPETYGALARAHPGRVLLVAIRDVTGEPRTDPRYEEAFRDLPDALWVLFAHPDGIPPLAFEAAR